MTTLFLAFVFIWTALAVLALCKAARAADVRALFTAGHPLPRNRRNRRLVELLGVNGGLK